MCIYVYINHVLNSQSPTPKSRKVFHIFRYCRGILKTGGVFVSPLVATMAPKKCVLQAPNHPNLHQVTGPRIHSPDGRGIRDNVRYIPVHQNIAAMKIHNNIIGSNLTSNNFIVKCPMLVLPKPLSY